MAAIAHEFTMTSRNVTLEGDKAVNCLYGWKALLEKNEEGSMTIKRNGEITHIQVTLNSDNTSLDIRISNIVICHQFEENKVLYLLDGESSSDRKYQAILTGKDAHGDKKPYIFYLNSLEDAFETNTLSFVEALSNLS